MNTSLGVLLVCLTLPAFGKADRQSNDKDKPNIIFIYTDDQAFWTTAYSGNQQAQTPHLDRLAAEGVFFNNAFVTTPVCSPSRVSLMTSRYSSEYGITDFIPQPGHRLYDAENPVGLDTASTTFAEVMQQNGYTTALFGKWHLGDWTETEDKRFHPRHNGFDYFMGLTGGGVSPKDPLLEKDGIVRKFSGLTDDILTSEALHFLDTAGNKPFLLCLHYRSPHTAWLPVAPEDWAPYENMDMVIPNPDYPDLNIPRVKTRMKEYLASTSGVDRNIGDILKKIKNAGIEKNTIVIFTSDNGYNMGHNGIEHKGNGHWIKKQRHPATENIAENSRPNLYDHSLRVPAIVWWPGTVTGGKKVDHTITNLDWYPTVLELAGLRLPEQHTVRGRSILPLLTGDKVGVWEDDFYGEYSMIHYSKAFMRCYRTPEWKLIRDFLNPGRDELYHLKEDPEERHNLIGSRSRIAIQMKKKLSQKIEKRMRDIHDPLLSAPSVAH